MQRKFKEYLEFKANQNIKRLFKDFIFILEDMKNNGLIEEEDYALLRKRVLDKGNDSIRDLSTELRVFEETLEK